MADHNPLKLTPAEAQFCLRIIKAAGLKTEGLSDDIPTLHGDTPRGALINDAIKQAAPELYANFLRRMPERKVSMEMLAAGGLDTDLPPSEMNAAQFAEWSEANPDKVLAHRQAAEAQALEKMRNEAEAMRQRSAARQQQLDSQEFQLQRIDGLNWAQRELAAQSGLLQ